MVTRILSYGATVNSTLNSQYILDPATTTALTFGYKVGQFAKGVTGVETVAGTVSLTDDATNIVAVDNGGTVTAVVSGTEIGNTLFKVVTASGVITDITDLRQAYK